MAQFEYRLNVLFDQTATGTYSEATQATPEQQLVINPVSQLCEHQYPINQFFNDLKYDPHVGIPLPQPETCLVYRHHYKLGVFELHDAIEIDLIKNLKTGDNWDQASQKMAGNKAIDDLKVSWIALGILSAQEESL